MGFEKYFAPEVIKLDLAGDTKKEVLRELVELLHKAGKINSKEEFYQAILKREEEGSTGLGYGVALPHGKSETVKELAVAVGRKKEGIEFGSLDGEQTRLFFMIADSPDYSREYLQIVSTLAGEVRKGNLRKKLMEAESKAEILKIISNIEEE